MVPKVSSSSYFTINGASPRHEKTEKIDPDLTTRKTEILEEANDSKINKYPR